MATQMTQPDAMTAAILGPDLLTKQYQLQRIQFAPEEPTVWLPAGKAVHSTIEQINLNRFREARGDGNSPDQS